MWEFFKLFFEFLKIFILKLTFKFILPFCIVFIIFSVFRLERNITIALIALIVTTLGIEAWDEIDD